MGKKVVIELTNEDLSIMLEAISVFREDIDGVEDIDNSLVVKRVNELESKIRTESMKGKFDVARWTTTDIDCRINELEIGISEEEKEGFIESVIDNLEVAFDSSVGINWDTIDHAIRVTCIDYSL
ncbi:MAG: hypothetical protein GY909_15695 [Oligoflexia bacterium]|nr:hypothetical protein [Oligoflexia bacterium]